MSEVSLPSGSTSRSTSPGMMSDWTCEMCPGYPGRGTASDSDEFESSVARPSSSQSGEIEDGPFESDKIQPLTSPIRHYHYYFDDGNVPLLVSFYLS